VYLANNDRWEVGWVKTWGLTKYSTVERFNPEGNVNIATLAYFLSKFAVNGMERSVPITSGCNFVSAEGVSDTFKKAIEDACSLWFLPKNIGGLNPLELATLKDLHIAVVRMYLWPNFSKYITSSNYILIAKNMWFNREGLNSNRDLTRYDVLKAVWDLYLYQSKN